MRSSARAVRQTTPRHRQASASEGFFPALVIVSMPCVMLLADLLGSQACGPDSTPTSKIRSQSKVEV